MAVEFRAVAAFVAVAEELHFGRAASRLGIAQSPLSQQVIRLERQLGVRLFNRTNRRVELSAEGSLLLPAARRVLQAEAGLRAVSDSLASGHGGCLRLGFVGSASQEAVPRVVAHVRKHKPGLELQLVEMRSPDQVDALLGGELDLGLARLPLPTAGLLVDVVDRERLVAAVPRSSRSARSGLLGVRDLAEEPFVLLPSTASGLAASVVQVCRAAGFTPQVRQVAGQVVTVLGLVAAGLGVSLVPASARRLRVPGVALIDLAEPDAVAPLVLTWPQDHPSPWVPFVRDAWLPTSR